MKTRILNKLNWKAITFLKQSPCFSLFNSTGEPSSSFEMISGEELTVFHAKYPARTAEKNTKRNLNGHIIIKKRKENGFDLNESKKKRWTIFKGSWRFWETKEKAKERRNLRSWEIYIMSLPLTAFLNFSAIGEEHDLVFRHI